MHPAQEFHLLPYAAHRLYWRYERSSYESRAHRWLVGLIAKGFEQRERDWLGRKLRDQPRCGLRLFGEPLVGDVERLGDAANRAARQLRADRLCQTVEFCGEWARFAHHRI